MRKTGRWSAILGVLALGGLLVPSTPVEAGHTSPAVECDFFGIVISSAGPFGEGGGGSKGNFGGGSIAGVPITSKLTCSGTINGAANLIGGFATCTQLSDPPDFERHPTKADWTGSIPSPAEAAGETTGFSCSGEYAWDSNSPGIDTDDDGENDVAVFTEALADAANPCVKQNEPGKVCHPNVHVAGQGQLDGDGWQWDHLTPQNDNCEFAFSGHAPSPVELQVLASCPQGDSPTHLITFERPNIIGFAPLFGRAADFFHVPGGTDFQHCEVNDATHTHVRADGSETTQTWVQENNPNPIDRARCARATIFNGVLTGTVTDL